TLRYKLLTRCSRPLCSSQETTPHQPPHHQRGTVTREDQPHPTTTPHTRRTAEGACSLTTQYRVSTSNHPTSPFHTPTKEGCTRKLATQRSAHPLMFHP